ncbi:hypothetical protein NDU88_002621 [Pleurodeles waltl]|uniref:Uncharacterized protein n=1 Tax=Pleurodeles waltl TaxID=8319 RepID=A0AAV7RAT4_PLEWA|nr:hypothetical protein NDU88_002621 [Pleurodeles waltl]
MIHSLLRDYAALDGSDDDSDDETCRGPPRRPFLDLPRFQQEIGTGRKKGKEERAACGRTEELDTVHVFSG